MIETLCCDDISWVIKLENLNFMQLCIYFIYIGIGEYNRIVNKKVIDTIQRKFMKAKIVIKKDIQIL